MPNDGVQYTVAECKARIRDINSKIEEFEDTPQVMRDGEVSANFMSRIQQLQGEREYWESQLATAREREEGQTSGIQGPDVEIR